MAVVTIFSDFGAQKNKACHCFHCFLIYLPWSDGTNSWASLRQNARQDTASEWAVISKNIGDIEKRYSSKYSLKERNKKAWGSEQEQQSRKQIDRLRRWNLSTPALFTLPMKEKEPGMSKQTQWDEITRNSGAGVSVWATLNVTEVGAWKWEK